LRRALNSVKSWVSKPANWLKLIKGGASAISRFFPGSVAGSVAGSLF
jgi:hypothetical protein